MPRSATDATRFTSTTPHASAIPTNKFPPRTPNLPGETPLERVKRLRASANKARDAQVTGFDRLIVRGRVWADVAHKTVNLFLIGSTGLSTFNTAWRSVNILSLQKANRDLVIVGFVTVYALGDMMIYNRKKKAEFQVIQKTRIESAVATARQAIEDGAATPQQIKFLALEDEHQAIVDAKQKKKEAPGMFAKAKAWLFSGLKNEEEGEDLGSSERRLGYEALSEEDDTLGERESDIVRAIEEKKIALQEKAKKAFEEEKERQRTGGPLDRLGTATEGGPVDEQPKKGGWTSWMDTRR